MSQTSRRLDAKSRRKAREVFDDMEGLSQDDVIAIQEAEQAVQDELEKVLLGLGITGGAVTVAGAVKDAQQEDGTPFINAGGSAALLGGLGGLGGHAIAVRDKRDYLNSPEQIRQRGNHGRIGAAVGGGAGLLLSLMNTLKDDQPTIYI